METFLNLQILTKESTFPIPMNFCEGFRRASERDWMLTPKK